jgi:hypothetical protein
LYKEMGVDSHFVNDSLILTKQIFQQEINFDLNNTRISHKPLFVTCIGLRNILSFDRVIR